MKKDKVEIINQSLEVIRKYTNDEEYQRFLEQLMTDNTKYKDSLPPEVLEELVYLQEKESTVLKKKN